MADAAAKASSPSTMGVQQVTAPTKLAQEANRIARTWILLVRSRARRALFQVAASAIASVVC
eukprot:3213400-Alexandrium_andersonii.AAC.1